MRYIHPIRHKTGRRTTFTKLSLQESSHGDRMLASLRVALYNGMQVIQSPSERRKVTLVVDRGFIHMVENLLYEGFISCDFIHTDSGRERCDYRKGGL